MKKLLSILSVCLLGTSSTVAVIGCSKKTPNSLQKIADELNGKTFNLDNSTKKYSEGPGQGKTWSSTKDLTDKAIIDQMKSTYDITLTPDQSSWLDWDDTFGHTWKYNKNTVSNLKIKHNGATAIIADMVFNVKSADFTPGILLLIWMEKRLILIIRPKNILKVQGKVKHEVQQKV